MSASKSTERNRHDELFLGEALDGFTPVPEGLTRLVVEWTKRRLATDSYRECTARLGEGRTAVAVEGVPVRGKHPYYVVIRELVDQIPMVDEEGQPVMFDRVVIENGRRVTRQEQGLWHNYDLICWKEVSDSLEALAILADLQHGYRLYLARNTDGHGDGNDGDEPEGLDLYRQMMEEQG
jgi:hypothetical protein